MNNYNKLINNLEILGLNKFVENLDHYIEYINNGSKTIIPIFIDDFDPSSLPQELWHKQGIKNDINLIQTLKNQFDDLLKSQEEIDRLNALKKQQKKKKIIIGSVVSLACVLIALGVLLCFALYHPKQSKGIVHPLRL